MGTPQEELRSPFEPASLQHEYLLGFQDFCIDRGFAIYYDPGCGGLAPWPRSWYVVAEEAAFRVYQMSNDMPEFLYADPECFEKLLAHLRTQ